MMRAAKRRTETADGWPAQGCGATTGLGITTATPNVQDCVCHFCGCGHSWCSLFSVFQHYTAVGRAESGAGQRCAAEWNARDGWPDLAFRSLLTLEGAPPEPGLLGWGLHFRLMTAFGVTPRRSLRRAVHSDSISTVPSQPVA